MLYLYIKIDGIKALKAIILILKIIYDKNFAETITFFKYSSI